MHCEDHRRHDAVVPHGHHQGVHHQPVPGRPHLQTEEHQQVGADPSQPAATVQVRHTEKHKLCRADNSSESRFSRRGFWTWEWRKCSLRQWEEIQLVIWHKPIIKLSGKYFPAGFNSQVLNSPCLFWNTSRSETAKNSKLHITAASLNVHYSTSHLFSLSQRV